MHRWLTANRSKFRAILAHLNTPISLSTWLLLENSEWDQLAMRWVDPLHYPEGVFSALKYRRDVQAVDLLRKAPLPTTFSRRTNALAAWEKAETQCANTNETLSRLWYLRDKFPELSRFASFLLATEKTIGRWLGPVPDDLVGGFGPGTCVEYDGGNPTVVDKIWLTPSTTPSAAPYFSVLYGRTHWGLSRTMAGLKFQDISRGNRLTTVPKDGKTDRPISIEPLGNLWLQLGIGRYLKQRLRLCGLPRFEGTTREIFPGLDVCYEDAQSVHRRLARLGRRSSFATIDLSSASDTLARELVRWVLPPDWFELLNDVRSHHTLLPKSAGGKYRLLEKFSSMGNGFTFELETIIFLGLLCTAFRLTPGKDCWVFGDDIIVPEHVSKRACNLLESVGFEVNRRKSYLSGPFRESCGGHFHSEVDVNPVRLKGVPENIQAIYSFHNALLAWGFPPAVASLWRSLIPSKYRFTGPRRLGDVVLHDTRYRTEIRPRHGTEIRWVRTLDLRQEDPLTLARWSPELSLTAVLLGIRPRFYRRGCRVTPAHGWASVS